MTENLVRDPSTRCRLVLVVPALPGAERILSEALHGGDIATVILPAGSLEEVAYQRHCESLVKLAQQAGTAALIAGDTRVAGRTGADGILAETPGENARDLVARFSPHKIVGFGGARERHRALELGEANPDFMFFGKTDGDIRPEPHPKNLAMANWWSHLIEIPCVIMGGSSLDSVVDCAASGAEFVALGLAVVSCTNGPREAVRQANELLDLHAPAFETE